MFTPLQHLIPLVGGTRPDRVMLAELAPPMLIRS